MSDNGETWWEFAMGRNLLKFQKKFDDVIFNSIL